MRAGDEDQVLAIYQAGLDTGDASFETAAPGWDVFDQGNCPCTGTWRSPSPSVRCWPWVAASPVSPRPVYRGNVIEHSIYVHPGAQGRGAGGALLAALTGSADAAIWTVQTGIFPENTASLRLHQRAGFRIVGTRERIGAHHGCWRGRHPSGTPQYGHGDLTRRRGGAADGPGPAPGRPVTIGL